MKRVIAVAAGLLLIGALAAPVAVSAAQGKPVTIVGKLVDPKCKPTDLVCMQKGAQAGHSLAVVAQGAKLYYITGGFAANKNAKLVALIGKNVQAIGKVTLSGAKQLLAATSVVAK
jgi:hypothetical protein